MRTWAVYHLPQIIHTSTLHPGSPHIKASFQASTYFNIFVSRKKGSPVLCAPLRLGHIFHVLLYIYNGANEFATTSAKADGSSINHFLNTMVQRSNIHFTTCYN